MVLLAKRVSASRCAANNASTSGIPDARAARCTWSNTPRHSSIVKTGAAVITLFAIRSSDSDIMEARRAGPVTCADHLFRLALAAVRDAPQHPMIAIGNGRAGVPELGRDPAVSWILQHPHAPAVANLPGDLAAELEVVAFIVDGPAPVGLHVDGVAHSAENLLQRLLAGQQTDVGHADERKPRPTGGAHGSIRPLLTDGRRRLARGHVSDELA